MRRIAFLAGVLVAVALLGRPSPSIAQEDAQGWLSRAALAAQQRDYDGVIAYVRDGQFDSVRVERDGARQRVLALTGDRRELEAADGELRGRYPGGVEMETPSGWFGPVAVDDATAAAIVRHYRLAIKGSDRVAGREAAVVDAAPIDAARYAYRLWFDRESGLLIGSLLLSPDGQPVERQVFTSIRIGPLRPASAPERPATTTAPPAGDGPVASGLPDGFRLIGAAPSAADGERQYVYSDGMASVSIYLGRGDAALRGASARGALNAYGRDLDGGHVVVVGELPAATVRRIAEAIDAAQLPP